MSQNKKATLVFERAFEGCPAHCEVHQKRNILHVIIRDLKKVNKKEIKENLRLLADHIEHNLPDNQSTVLVVDAREGANPDLIKHMTPFMKFKKRIRKHTRSRIMFTLLVAPDKPTHGIFKTMTIGGSTRPIYITLNSIPWEEDTDLTPELFHATKEAMRAQKKQPSK
jgi:hypothetical protein